MGTPQKLPVGRYVLTTFNRTNAMTKTKKTSRTSGWTIARLIASGALLGISVAGLVGVDTSVLTTIFGASGAVAAAIMLKAVHIF